MFRVDRQTYGAIWGLIGLLLAAGWVVYGMAANGNRTFLTVMVVASILLGGGASFIFRSRDSQSRN